jgi:hypothetical protein
VVLTFSILIFAVLYRRSLALELQEAREQDEVARNTIQPIETIGRMSKHHVQHAVLLIKDYKYRGKICMGIEISLLVLISSVSCHIMTLPYAALFVILGSLTCLGSSSTQRKFSQFINKPLMFGLICDLFTQFLIKSGRILAFSNSSSIGFLSTPSTYISFYLKLALFLLECQKHQYNYDFVPLYQQLYGAFSDKSELRPYFVKKQSLGSRILQPFS